VLYEVIRGVLAPAAKAIYRPNVEGLDNVPRHGAVILAGGHCVPVMLADPARMIWYSLYMSTRHRKDAAMAENDLMQAATLAAILIEQNGLVLRESYRGAPRELRNAAHSRLARLEGVLDGR